eukprot:gene88-115_t
MKLAIIGATGLVGNTLLQLLEERKFPITKLLLVASENSEGQVISFSGKAQQVITLDTALAERPTLAIFAVGASISLDWAPRFAAIGTVVIDNSTAWRMHPDYKLVIPEINAHLLTASDKIIANPNCSTIQLLMALYPLHNLYTLKRVIISTYQAVTGTGKIAVKQLLTERQGQPQVPSPYPHPIDLNVIPQVDDFLENGYTKEEMKMVNESRKILNIPSLRVTATAVRVPVVGGHSMAVNAMFEQDFKLDKVLQVLQRTPGLVVQDAIAHNQYPMPMVAQNKDEVFVGRIRRDESEAAALNVWIVADNLRKGAATNAIQIAEYLKSQRYI